MLLETLKPVFHNIINPGKIISISEDPLTFGDGNFFLSLLTQVKIKFDENGTAQTKLFLVKESNPFIRSGGSISTDRTFFNEITFYQKFSTHYAKCIPEFYYGKLGSEDGKHYLIVEFLMDYHLTPEMRTLSSDHFEYACRQLGVFHGLGYLAKAQDESFVSQCKELQEVRYSTDAMEGSSFEIYLKICQGLSKRTFKFLPGKEAYDPEVIEKYQTLLRDLRHFPVDLIKPKNNLAVLCHGDYNRNNIMFQYDENNQIKSMKMFDFQTVRYTQPGTEIALLFQLNTKADDLEQNYVNYLRMYHESLIETIRPKLSLEGFEFDRFLEDYVKHCWIGFINIVFFHALLDDPVKFDEEHTLALLDLSEEEADKILGGMGTDDTFVSTGKVLKHCIDLTEKYSNK